MLTDIYNNLNCESRLIIRVFKENNCHELAFKDMSVDTREKIEKIDKIFTISCIVPSGNDLIIEGTID